MVFFVDVVHGQKQCDAVIDLMLIVDSSGSILPEDFERAKQALIDLVGRLNVATKKAGVAIINFASNMTLSGQSDVFEFNQPDLLAQIGALEQIGSRTATGDALALARSYCEASCRNISEGIPRVFVIITDGHSNMGQEPIPVADSLRTSPIEGTIFAIGIGEIGTEGQKELLGIAGDPDYVLSIGSYLSLLPITNAIASKMCDFPAFVVPNRMIHGQVTENQSRYYKMNTLHHLAKSALFEIRLSHLSGRVSPFRTRINTDPCVCRSLR